MTSVLVVGAPATLPAWHAEYEPAARPDLLAPLCKSSGIVLNMLEHLERANDVELLSDVSGGPRDDAAPPSSGESFSCDSGGLGVDLGAYIVVIGREPRPEPAEARTDLENRVDRQTGKAVPDKVVAMPAAQRQRRQHGRIVVVCS